MILTLLAALPLAFQGGPAHAGLHAADADLYLELADVTSVLAALDRTPLLQFARDERLKELRGLAAGAGVTLERPLAEVLREGLASAYPNAQVGEWLAGLKSVSLSFRAPAAAGAEGAPELAVLAIADFAAPEQAAALRAALLSQVAHAPESGPLPGLERITLENAGALQSPWCAVVDARLVLGSGAAKPEDYVARAQKGAPGLGAELAKRLAGLQAAAGTPIGWFALARPIDAIVDALGAEDDAGFAALKSLPQDLNPLGSARVARMSFADGRFVTEMLASGETTASAAVQPEWLAPVPPGSMLLYATAFDGPAAAKRVRELLAKDETATAMLAQIEAKLGYGPERVLAHLGPEMTVYSGPPTGLGLPDMRLWIGCDDPAAFASEFEALVGAFGEGAPGVQARTRPYKVKVKGSDERVEVPITTLSLPPDLVQLPMITLAPSFAPVGGKLVFAAGSMDVKNELKRVLGGEGEPIAADGAGGALGFALPANAQSVFVMDWAKLLGGIVGTVQAFAGMAQPGDLPFDPKQLPSPEMFAQYFKPTFHYSKATEGGTYRRHEASFGPETWLGLAGAALLAQQATQSLGAPHGAPPPQPADHDR